MKGMNMEKIKNIKYPIVIIVMLLIGGCASRQKITESKDNLFARVEAYNNMFQEKRFADAVIFVIKDKKKKFIDDVYKIRNTVGMDSFNILDIRFTGDRKKGMDQTKAEVTVIYKMFVLPDIVLRDRKEIQRWIKVNGAWHIIPDLHNFIGSKR